MPEKDKIKLEGILVHDWGYSYVYQKPALNLNLI